ncbi:hypothetical protein A4R26_23705 [Niastella populi]|uniref:DUF3857 domain-containing protein n=2 Tax=Niastella populi TaxID=550983 RepID=A0A1V9FHS1_9BACT|nr:hypothetical protein A4R26_23705 [Niastella populi]
MFVKIWRRPFVFRTAGISTLNMKNMLRTISLVFLLFIFQPAIQAQTDDDYWATWNQNYPETDIKELLAAERKYADSIEKHPEIAPYYFRTGKYRFIAEYTGETRKADTAVLGSVKRVHKMKGGDPAQIDNLVKSDVLFKVGAVKLWMPVQQRILEAMKQEAKKGDSLMLYCAFFNEHTSKKKLYTIFLISEFSR